MKMILHILKKDFGRLKWLLAGWLLVLALQAYFNAQWLWSDWQVEKKYFGVIDTLQQINVIFMAVLVPLLVLGDSLASSRAFWLTRPISRMTLLFAKLAFLLIFIIVPYLLAAGVTLLDHGFTISQVVSVIPGMVLSKFFIIIPIFILASLMANFTACLATGLIFLVLLITGRVAMDFFVGLFGEGFQKIFINSALDNAIPFNYSLYWSIIAIKIFICTLILTVIILNQYSNRRTRDSVARIIILLLLLFTVDRFWTIDFLQINALKSTDLGIGHLVKTDINKEDPIYFRPDSNSRDLRFYGWEQQVNGLLPNQFTRISLIKNSNILYSGDVKLTGEPYQRSKDLVENGWSYNKYIRPLHNLFQDYTFANGRRVPESSVCLLTLPNDMNIKKFLDREGKYKADALFNVYEWKVRSVIPVRRGSQAKMGFEQMLFQYYSDENKYGGISFIIREKSLLPLIPFGDRKNGENDFGQNTMFLLMNKKTKEAYVVSDMTEYNVRSRMPFIPLSSRTVEIVAYWGYSMETSTIEKINEAWLADAVLVRLEAVPVGYFWKTLEYDKISIFSYDEDKSVVSDDGRVMQSFYWTGELQTESVKQENGQVHYKTFDKGGALKEEWDIDEDSKFIVSHKEYYENGKLLYEYTYRNGKIEGPVRKYSPDGNLISERMFRRGKDISHANK